VLSGGLLAGVAGAGHQHRRAGAVLDVIVLDVIVTGAAVLTSAVAGAAVLESGQRGLADPLRTRVRSLPRTTFRS